MSYLSDEELVPPNNERKKLMPENVSIEIRCNKNNGGSYTGAHVCKRQKKNDGVDFPSIEEFRSDRFCCTQKVKKLYPSAEIRVKGLDKCPWISFFAQSAANRKEQRINKPPASGDREADSELRTQNSEHQTTGPAVNIPLPHPLNVRYRASSLFHDRIIVFACH